MADGTSGKGGCIAAAIVAVLCVCVLILWTCTEKIEANKIGVRTMLSASGIEQIDHKPGYVLRIPGYHSVRLWDPTWTNMKQVLQIRGSDQYTTQVDVSIVFRIEPGRCHEVAHHFRDEDHVEQRVQNTLNKYANEI